MVIVCGLIADVQSRVNKEGKVWAIATVEDLDAAIEVLFFAKSYEIFADAIIEDNVVAVRGRVNQRDNGNSVVGMDLAVLDIGEDDINQNPPFVIIVPAGEGQPDLHRRAEDTVDRSSR